MIASVLSEIPIEQAAKNSLADAVIRRHRLGFQQQQYATGEIPVRIRIPANPVDQLVAECEAAEDRRRPWCLVVVMFKQYPGDGLRSRQMLRIRSPVHEQSPIDITAASLRPGSEFASSQGAEDYKGAVWGDQLGCGSSVANSGELKLGIGTAVTNGYPLPTGAVCQITNWILVRPKHIRTFAPGSFFDKPDLRTFVKESRPATLGYSLFSDIRADLRRIRDLQVAYLREMQAIIARSTPNECVGLLCLQLMNLSERPSNALLEDS